MKISSIVCIILIAVVGGALFTALHYEWILIRLPLKKIVEKKGAAQPKTERKKVTLHFWHHEAWHTETTDILVSQEAATTLSHLIQAWLALLEEEHVTDKKIHLQTALITPAGVSYISLIRNPFSKEAATIHKLRWVQGLLKTVKNNLPGVHQVQFLVHHKPLHDYHLDFSNPWPVNNPAQ